MRLLRIASEATLVLCVVLLAATYAQTDEIQVYTGEINKPGELSIMLHNNFTPIGQYHALFGVIDYTSDPLNLEFGIGHRFTAVSESLILKLIVTRSF
jgi:hypothetical protein